METKEMAIIGLVSILIATVMIVPAAAQPTPFVINGYTFAQSAPVDNPTVTVTNLNTNEVFVAKTNESSNYYRLVLKNSSDVKEGDRLRIIAKNVTADDTNKYHPNGSTYIVSVTNHTVTSDNITAGGMFNVNLTLSAFCIHFDYPYYPNEEWNYSGAAVMDMWTEFKNESTGYNQAQLQAMGIANNSDPTLDVVDPRGMANTLKGLITDLPPRHTFLVGRYSTTDCALRCICWWQWTGPGALPTLGGYTNWMAVRGMHTSEDPHGGGGYYGYDVEGFWLNDPNSTGIGENSYKTAQEWTTTYYEKIVAGLPYEGYYITMYEPPEHEEAEVGIASSPARFTTEAKQAVQAARTAVQAQKIPGKVTSKKVMDAGMRVLKAEAGDAVEEANKWIVQAAIDGAMEQLAPYDEEFAAIFEDAVAVNPMLVTNDAGDYYLVPFAEKTYKDSVEQLDTTIAELEALKRSVPDAYNDAIQSAIDELTALRNELNAELGDIMVVVIVDAEDGHFKEASWIQDSMRYLPVSEEEALVLVGDSEATAELIYRGLSYYPTWNVTTSDGDVYYVDQDETVTQIVDSDGDGVLDAADNCRLTPNTEQQDTDGDGYGNICDCDLNNDDGVNMLDFNIFRDAWGTTSTDPNYNADADFDSDGDIDSSDFNIFRGRWGTSAPWE